jgi:hypothetical protein
VDTCSRHGEARNVYKNSVRTPKLKNLHGINRHRLEDNIKFVVYEQVITM